MTTTLTSPSSAPVTTTNPHRRVICFIDDDPREIARFKKAMEHQYDVIATTNLEGCLEELKRRGRSQPDLWVLDLFFPGQRATSEQERQEMNTKNAALKCQADEFRNYLDRIGQGAKGGKDKLDDCKKIGGPIIMLTRKGTLRDAIECKALGAFEVLEKPMPVSWPTNVQDAEHAMDEAMIAHASQLIDFFGKAIRANTHWARWKSVYISVLSMAAGAALSWGIQRLLSLIG